MSKELEISLTSPLALPTEINHSFNLRKILTFTMSSMGVVGLFLPVGIAAMAGSLGWLFMFPITITLGIMAGYGLLPQFFLIRHIGHILKKNGTKLTLRDKISIWMKNFSYWQFSHVNENTGLSIELGHDRRAGCQEIYIDLSVKDDLNETLHNALIVKNGSIGKSYDESNHVTLENTTEAQNRILDQVEKMNKSLTTRSSKDKKGYSMAFSEDDGLSLRFEKDDMFNELKDMCEKDFHERMNKIS